MAAPQNSERALCADAWQHGAWRVCVSQGRCEIPHTSQGGPFMIPPYSGVQAAGTRVVSATGDKKVITIRLTIRPRAFPSGRGRESDVGRVMPHRVAGTRIGSFTHYSFMLCPNNESDLRRDTYLSTREEVSTELRVYIPARRRSGGTPDGGFVLEALARSGARSTAQGTYFNNAITKNRKRHPPA